MHNRSICNFNVRYGFCACTPEKLEEFCHHDICVEERAKEVKSKPRSGGRRTKKNRVKSEYKDAKGKVDKE